MEDSEAGQTRASPGIIITTRLTSMDGGRGLRGRKGWWTGDGKGWMMMMLMLMLLVGADADEYIR